MSHSLLSKVEQHLKAYRGEEHYFLKKAACASRNSFLNCRGNALLMWNPSNCSHFTSSSITYSCCTHWDSVCNSPSLSASLLSGRTAILLEDAGGWPICNIQGHSAHSSLRILSAWYMFSSLHLSFQRDRQWNVLGRNPEVTFNC